MRYAVCFCPLTRFSCYNFQLNRGLVLSIPKGLTRYSHLSAVGLTEGLELQLLIRPIKTKNIVLLKIDFNLFFICKLLYYGKLCISNSLIDAGFNAEVMYKRHFFAVTASNTIVLSFPHLFPEATSTQVLPFQYWIL